MIIAISCGGVSKGFRLDSKDGEDVTRFIKEYFDKRAPHLVYIASKYGPPLLVMEQCKRMSIPYVIVEPIDEYGRIWSQGIRKRYRKVRNTALAVINISRQEEFLGSVGLFPKDYSDIKYQYAIRYCEEKATERLRIYDRAQGLKGECVYPRIPVTIYKPLNSIFLNKTSTFPNYQHKVLNKLVLDDELPF